MNDALKMIEEFIANRYEPLDFSYDFPDYLIEHYDEMLEEDRDKTAILNEELPDICAEYERGMDPTEFIEKVKIEYNKVK